MSLKIIGAGHGRTGTNSLKLALEKLLGEPCYHMFEAFDHPEHMPVWTEAARGNPPDWHSFLEAYGATVDEPAAAFWPELMEAYPDAIVLLSVRDTEDWWRKCKSNHSTASRFHGAWAIPGYGPGSCHARRPFST